MQEYLLGSLFGISQVIIGHPFDTLKINLQNSKNVRIFIKNPILLYRGLCYPLSMNIFGTSCLFGNFDYFYKETNNKIISGVLTGIISAIIITPFDYKKIHLQSSQPYIQSQIQNKVILNNYKNIGNNIKKYYCGFAYTFAREIISIPIYFYSYHYLYEITNPFIAGGIAGVNSWLFSYPIDTLKTRKQLYQTKTFKELVGMGSLCKGLLITLLRAFIVNGSSFYIYNLIKPLTIVK